MDSFQKSEVPQGLRNRRGLGEKQMRMQIVAWLQQGERILENFDRLYPGLDSGSFLDERVLKTVEEKLDYFQKLADGVEKNVQKSVQKRESFEWLAIYGSGMRDLHGVKSERVLMKQLQKEIREQYAKTIGLQDICSYLDEVIKGNGSNKL